MSSYFYYIWKNTNILDCLEPEHLEMFMDFENNYRILMSKDYDYIYIHYLDGNVLCRFKTINHEHRKIIDAVFYKNDFEVDFVKRTTVYYFINLLERKLYEYKK